MKNSLRQRHIKLPQAKAAKNKEENYTPAKVLHHAQWSHPHHTLMLNHSSKMCPSGQFWFSWIRNLMRVKLIHKISIWTTIIPQEQEGMCPHGATGDGVVCPRSDQPAGCVVGCLLLIMTVSRVSLSRSNCLVSWWGWCGALISRFLWQTHTSVNNILEGVLGRALPIIFWVHRCLNIATVCLANVRWWKGSKD